MARRLSYFEQYPRANDSAANDRSGEPPRLPAQHSPCPTPSWENDDGAPKSAPSQRRRPASEHLEKAGAHVVGNTGRDPDGRVTSIPDLILRYQDQSLTMRSSTLPSFPSPDRARSNSGSSLGSLEEEIRQSSLASRTLRIPRSHSMPSSDPPPPPTPLKEPMSFIPLSSRRDSTSTLAPSASLEREMATILASPSLSILLTLSSGRTVSLSDIGRATGPVVVLLLGLGCARHLAALYADLVDTLGLRLITIDRWGAGETSDVPESERSYVAWGAVVEEVLDQLSIGPFALVAHSFGTPFALATSLRLAPRLRGSVHLLAPWPAGVEESDDSVEPLNGAYKLLRFVPPTWVTWLAKGREWEFSLRSSFRFGSGSKPPLSSDSPDLHPSSEPSMRSVEWVAAILHLSHAASIKSSSADLRDILASPPRLLGFSYASLRSRHPFSLWVGSKDKMISLAGTRWLEQQLGTRCTVQIIEGAGHGLLLEQGVMVQVLESLAQELGAVD